MAAAQGWPIQLAGVRAEQQRELALKVSQVSKVVKTPFSSSTVLECLLKFIVATDQVLLTILTSSRLLITLQAMNIVEDIHFRNLLGLFRHDFNQDDLPHRSKVRSAIMEAWQAWFLGLKKELKVNHRISLGQ